MKTVLAFGAGIDSTAILAMIQDPEAAASHLGIERAELEKALPLIDAAVFSDPGAEFPATYRNVAYAQRRCQEAGIHFETVRKDNLTITAWLEQNGNVPLLPGGKHVCSLKFKGEVVQKWARDRYGQEPVLWLVGIEADEGHRTKRFSPPTDGQHQFAYPLVDLALTRSDCVELIKALGWGVPVEKSSCTFCPYMSEAEIHNLYTDHPDAWELAREIEDRFHATSSIKHQKWIDAGRPRTGPQKAGRAPKGMWSKDAWAEGARLFAKSIDGRRLSLAEWERHFADQARQVAFAFA